MVALSRLAEQLSIQPGVLSDSDLLASLAPLS